MFDVTQITHTLISHYDTVLTVVYRLISRRLAIKHNKL